MENIKYNITFKGNKITPLYLRLSHTDHKY